LDNAGISINNDGSSFDMDEEDIDDVEEEEPKRAVSIEDLEKMMEGALANEEYEIAAELRDRIQTLKGEIK